MMNCLQFCYHFAFNFNLRCYNTAQEHTAQVLTEERSSLVPSLASGSSSFRDSSFSEASTFSEGAIAAMEAKEVELARVKGELMKAWSTAAAAAGYGGAS
jgi:hypothetical protein